MYPDLFKGFGLKSQDLIKYDTPLVSFHGRVVISKGQISLPVNMEGKEVMVTFIVVGSFSPNTAILGRPWIHAWTPYEVLGVDPEFIVHKLNIDPSFPPKKQKPRRSAREHVEAV